MKAKKNRGANGSQGSKWIRPEKRQAIYARDAFMCLWCVKQLSPPNMTLDHLRGRGDNHPRNLITACLSCNSSRQDTPWRKFGTPEAIARIERHTRRKLPRSSTSAQRTMTSTSDGLDEARTGTSETQFASASHAPCVTGSTTVGAP